MKEPRYTTHPRVVAGVMLMASLMLFSVVFTIAIVLFGIVNPPESSLVGVAVPDPPLSAYFTQARVLIAGAIAALTTVGFWIAVSED